MYKGDHVHPLRLFEYHNWLCGICKMPIDRSLRQPDPMCATLDHVVPLGLGGRHVLENLQAAHRLCNETKGCSGPDYGF